VKRLTGAASALPALPLPSIAATGQADLALPPLCASQKIAR
jgi:hypothetical protein